MPQEFFVQPTFLPCRHVPNPFATVPTFVALVFFSHVLVKIVFGNVGLTHHALDKVGVVFLHVLFKFPCWHVVFTDGALGMTRLGHFVHVLKHELVRLETFAAGHGPVDAFLADVVKKVEVRTLKGTSKVRATVGSIINVHEWMEDFIGDFFGQAERVDGLCTKKTSFRERSITGSLVQLKVAVGALHTDHGQCGAVALVVRRLEKGAGKALETDREQGFFMTNRTTRVLHKQKKSFGFLKRNIFFFLSISSQ
jgi:hypothetical protein